MPAPSPSAFGGTPSDEGQPSEATPPVEETVVQPSDNGNIPTVQAQSPSTTTPTEENVAPVNITASANNTGIGNATQDSLNQTEIS